MMGAAARRSCSWYRTEIRRISKNVGYAPDFLRSTLSSGRGKCYRRMRHVDREWKSMTLDAQVCDSNWRLVRRFQP